MGFREVLPAALQEIVQDGLLDGVFQDALVPAFLYDAIAEVRPWGGQIGSESVMTRDGLMKADPTPATGSDAQVGNAGYEQYRVKMDQYGKSRDTNMLLSGMALANKFVNDNKILAIHAADSLNLLARGALYGVYGIGNTWVSTAAASGATTIVVNDATGFQKATSTLAKGTNTAEALAGEDTPELVPVSGSNALDITIDGTANTVTGCDLATNTLTLGTALAAAVAVGADVVSSIGDVSFRPGGKGSAADLVAGDLATLALFQSAVTRLRKMNVKPVHGAYTAHVDPQTVDELFADPAFQRVYTGRSDSAAYRDFSLGADMGNGSQFLGRFAGIDWIMNTVTPTVTNPSGVEVYRPIVVGEGALIKAPFEDMGSLLEGLSTGSTVEIRMIGGVARIWRAPLDRFGQVITSTWSWVGGFTSGTDLLTGDAAAYKRACVVEHA